MQAWVWLLVALAGVVAAAVTISALRHPVLARMARRNALRRPRQTATVIAGLMVGTAIVAAALVAGGSASHAIRGYVYQSMGHIDESVTLTGYSYFSDDVFIGIHDDPSVQGVTDGVTAFAIWEGAVSEPESGLFGPSVFIAGFDPATSADGRFGWFEDDQGRPVGTTLQPGTAIVTDDLAAELDLQPGDTLHLAFTPPIDPAVPEIHLFSGNLTGTDILPLPPLPAIPVPLPGGTPFAAHPFNVTAGATTITVIAAWDAAPLPGPSTGFTAEVLRPDGVVAATASAAAPPLWLNITVGPEEVLTEGTWRLELHATAAGEAYGGAVVVGYPVYNLTRLRERAESLREAAGPAAEALEGTDPFGERVEATLTVAAIASGGRAEMFDFRRGIFVRLDDAQSMFGREGQVNYVAVSNPGGVEEGAAGSDRAMVVLNATLERIKGQYPGVPSIQALTAKPEKQDFLEVADDAGQTMTSLLVFAGSLSVITGLLLILNIFTMLAEERRSELGMARAVGMSRRDLVRTFLYEGSLYAITAAALGALLGLALAFGMIWVMNLVIAQLGADLSFPPVEYRPTWDAVLGAFSVGVLLTFATIWAASRRQSRLNIVRAIRRIEEPERTGSWTVALWWGAPLLALGVTATAAGWLPNLHFTGRFTLQVLGPLLAVAGAGLMLRPVLKRRILYPLLALAIMAYYTTTMFVITSFDNITEANIVGPLRGVILALALVVVLVYFERGTRWLGRGLSRVRRLQAVALPAVSYPLHRKFRTGMTLAMFALVILSIGFFSIFGGLFDTDPERQTGGFDIEARTTLTVADIDAHGRGVLPPDAVEVRHELRVYSYEDPDFIRVEGGGTGRLGDFRHHVYGYDADFAGDNGFRLLWRDAAYATDEQAYQAVLDNDGLVIVGYIYSTDERNQDLSYGVGDTLTMNLGDEALEYTIIGIQEQFHHAAIWLPKETVRGLFPTTEGLYLYRLNPGHDAGETARLLEQEYRDVGMDADDAEAEVLREQQSFRNILSAMKLFLGLGLIVGVLSLGIITSRSVLERRQEIGMLRALGFTGNQVRRIFFIEVTYTLLLGAAAGLACAVLVTYGLWYAIIRELQYPYTIAWGEIGLLVLVSYLVALLATMAPIRRSARVAPAEALRYVE